MTTYGSILRNFYDNLKFKYPHLENIIENNITVKDCIIEEVISNFECFKSRSMYTLLTHPLGKEHEKEEVEEYIKNTEYINKYFSQKYDLTFELAFENGLLVGFNIEW